MARLIDVAKAAGVSRGTASNVFNNPDIVRPALRAKVERAAADLGYSGPDPKGRLLREGRYNALAVMPPSRWSVRDSLRNPVFHQFIQGVGEACDEVGADLVVISGRPERASLSTALADGVIFARVDQLADVEPARLRRLPFAVVDLDGGPGVNSVRVDAYAGAKLAAEHMLELGHRRFAIISFLRDTGSLQVHEPGTERPPSALGNFIDQEKYRGYADALAEAGLDIADMPMVQADVYDPQCASVLLDLAPTATAVLSMSAMQAVSVIRTAQERGMEIPGDLSVVGYNDTLEGRSIVPALTTVDAKAREKGYRAARIIFAGGKPRQEIVQPELIFGATTAPVRS